MSLTSLLITGGNSSCFNFGMGPSNKSRRNCSRSSKITESSGNCALLLKQRWMQTLDITNYWSYSVSEIITFSFRAIDISNMNWHMFETFGDLRKNIFYIYLSYACNGRWMTSHTEQIWSKDMVGGMQTMASSELCYRPTHSTMGHFCRQ